METRESASPPRCRSSAFDTEACFKPNATLSDTERNGKSAYDWKTVFTFRLFGGFPETSAPSSRMRPAVGSSKPAISRSVVVFPHPDGPSSEKNSPPETDRSMLSTAACAVSPCPNRLVSPTSSMPAAMMSAPSLRLLLRLLGSGLAADGGEGGQAAAAFTPGQQAVAEVAEDDDDQRHRQHDGAEGVQRRAAVPAVLRRVDDHRHRSVARARGEQVDDHEVVDHAGEHQDGAGEDGRGEQRDHDPAHDLELVRAQVGGGLLVLPADGDQARLY